jgi:hypothetical protein
MQPATEPREVGQGLLLVILSKMPPGLATATYYVAGPNAGVRQLGPEFSLTPKVMAAHALGLHNGAPTCENGLGRLQPYWIRIRETTQMAFQM